MEELSNSKENKMIKKWVKKNLNRPFRKNIINKSMKRCSISLTIREWILKSWWDNITYN